ncbi:MAG: hypothetical protein Q7T61_04130 [Caulobacter sp.]|nr:hypothetical protein [Caulobacter sp.]
MKALALGLAATLLAGQALAADAGEEALYHWGQCAAVGALYEAAIDEGSADPDVAAATRAFHEVEPRMEAHTNALADALGKQRADGIQARLLSEYDGDIALWVAAEDADGFLRSTWGPTMDRCLKEAAALPADKSPKT